MTVSSQTLDQANSLIAEIYDGLRNLGPVQSYIQPSPHTADFDLFDGTEQSGEPTLRMRAIEEKDSVYFHIFRAK